MIETESKQTKESVIKENIFSLHNKSLGRAVLMLKKSGIEISEDALASHLQQKYTSEHVSLAGRKIVLKDLPGLAHILGIEASSDLLTKKTANADSADISYPSGIYGSKRH